MYKAKDLRDQSLEELEATYDESCKKAISNLIIKLKATKKREKPHEIKHARKDIARLLDSHDMKSSQRNQTQVKLEDSHGTRRKRKSQS